MRALEKTKGEVAVFDLRGQCRRVIAACYMKKQDRRADVDELITTSHKDEAFAI
jgi:hypothetical protein